MFPLSYRLTDPPFLPTPLVPAPDLPGAPANPDPNRDLPLSPTPDPQPDLPPTREPEPGLPERDRDAPAPQQLSLIHI